jgi:hypothetical protein
VSADKHGVKLPHTEQTAVAADTNAPKEHRTWRIESNCEGNEHPAGRLRSVNLEQLQNRPPASSELAFRARSAGYDNNLPGPPAHARKSKQQTVNDVQGIEHGSEDRRAP